MNKLNSEIKKYLDIDEAHVTIFDFVNPELDIPNQVDILREDMGCLYFSNGNYTIDFGWKPEFDIKGEFIIYLIKDDNWDTPLKVLRNKSIDGFLKDMQDCIAFVKQSHGN